MRIALARSRNSIRTLAAGIALCAGPAFALPLRPATFVESASACSAGVQLDGAVGLDNLQPEAVHIEGSATTTAGDVSWNGTAITQGSPDPRASAQATNTNVGGACSPLVAAALTYDVEVVPVAGAPSVAVRVFFSAYGEVANGSPFTTGSVGTIQVTVRGVDPTSGNVAGSPLWTVYNLNNLAYTLNESTTLFLRGGDVVRVFMNANCVTQIGSCSAFIDPLPVIDPTQLIVVDGVNRPATDFFSLAFSSNIPEPGSGGLAALGLGLLVCARRARTSPRRML
jgi:hypothetical protein